MTHAAQCQGATFLATEIGVQMTDDRNQIVNSELGKKLMNAEHRTSNIERSILMALRFTY